MDSFSFTDKKDFDDFDEMPTSILDHLNLVEGCFSEKRLLMKTNAMDCTKHAEAMNVFPLSRNILSIENDVPPIDLLDANSSNFEALWKTEYEDRKKMWKSKTCMSLDRNSHSNSREHTLSSSTIIMQADACASSQSTVPSSAYIQPLLIASTSIDRDAIAKKWTLNNEQIKAFHIITDHVLCSLTSPLRMFLNGSAGTGKSRIINAVKDFFDIRGEDRKFRLASYMGIAARNINGMTLHQLLCLKSNTSVRKNTKALQELKNIWEGVEYLFIDEVSMIGCKFLYKISETLSNVTGDTRAFGGLSVIFAGDFAQLPPVKATRLYAHIDTRRREQTSSFQDTVSGKMLWLSVDVVVHLHHLHQQQGLENAEFQALLSRL